jgi:hypothetical protein
VDRFRRESRSTPVLPLRISDTTALLSSVFGEVPYVDSISEWVHNLSGGNPRTSLELAQQLVDQGVARFEDGRWRLPASLESFKLPQDIDQALEARIDTLSPEARELAEALALTADNEPLLLAEYAALTQTGELDGIFRALSELVAAAVLVQRNASYAYVHQKLKEAVRRAIPPTREPEIHRRLARAYASSALSAYHHFKAGDAGAAFEKMVVSKTKQASYSGRGAAFRRSGEGVRLYEEVFEWARQRAVPPHQLAVLGKAILQLAAVADERLSRYAPPILERLRYDIGLDRWDDFSDAADASERVRRCVGAAFERFQTTPENQRGLDPMQAIQELALSAMMLTAVYGRTGEGAAIAELADLIDPLRPLSPAVEVLFKTLTYTARAMRGQTATELKLEVLQRSAEPIFGIDETSRAGLDMITRYYLALEEVLSGLETPLERLAPLESHPTFTALTWQIRMLSCLAQGEQQQAEECRRKRDLAVTGGVPSERHLDTSVHYENLLYVALEDLSALRHILPALKERSARFPRWKIDYHLAAAACHVLRGKLDKAVLDYEEGLRLMSGPDHACWAPLVTGLVQTLTRLGRAEEARELASRALAECEGLSLLPINVDRLEMAFALAQAEVGELVQAKTRAAQVVERAEARKTVGALLIDLLVSHARVAVAVGEPTAFTAAAQRVRVRCAELGRAPYAARKAAELELLESSSFGQMSAGTWSYDAVDSASTTFAHRIRTELGRCQNRTERAELGLQLLLEHSPSDQAFLYFNSPDGPVLMVAFPGPPPPPELDERVAEFVRTFNMEAQTTTAVAIVEGAPLTADAGFDLVPITADRDGDQIVVAVAAVAQQKSARPIPTTALWALGQGLLEPEGYPSGLPTTFI